MDQIRRQAGGANNKPLSAESDRKYDALELEGGRKPDNRRKKKQCERGRIQR